MYIIKGTFTDKIGGTFWINLKEESDTLKRTLTAKYATKFNQWHIAADEIVGLYRENENREIYLTIEEIKEDK